MSNALDMRARIRSVNDKITYAAEVSANYNLIFSICEMGADRGWVGTLGAAKRNLPEEAIKRSKDFWW